MSVDISRLRQHLIAKTNESLEYGNRVHADDPFEHGFGNGRANALIDVISILDEPEILDIPQIDEPRKW